MSDNINVAVRLTKAEKKELSEKAKSENRSLANYLAILVRKGKEKQ